MTQSYGPDTRRRVCEQRYYHGQPQAVSHTTRDTRADERQRRRDTPHRIRHAHLANDGMAGGGGEADDSDGTSSRAATRRKAIAVMVNVWVFRLCHGAGGPISPSCLRPRGARPCSSGSEATMRGSCTPDVHAVMVSKT